MSCGRDAAPVADREDATRIYTPPAATDPPTLGDQPGKAAVRNLGQWLCDRADAGHGLAAIGSDYGNAASLPTDGIRAGYLDAFYATEQLCPRHFPAFMSHWGDFFPWVSPPQKK